MEYGGRGRIIRSKSKKDAHEFLKFHHLQISVRRMSLATFASIMGDTLATHAEKRCMCYCEICVLIEKSSQNLRENACLSKIMVLGLEWSDPMPNNT